MVLSKHYFPFITTFLPYRTESFQCSFNVPNLIQSFQTDLVHSSTQSSLFIQNYCYTDYPVSCHPYCKSVLPQLSILTVIYLILGFKLLSPTLLVEMPANFRPPSHQSILCIYRFSPFLSKFTPL